MHKLLQHLFSLVSLRTSGDSLNSPTGAFDCQLAVLMLKKVLTLMGVLNVNVGLRGPLRGKLTDF